MNESLLTSNVPDTTFQHLKISPTALNFSPPLNRLINCQLHLENITSSHVTYKIKTTAPKRYCVRPNIGVLKPREETDILILGNFPRDPVLTNKNRDLFQVLSRIVPADKGIPEDTKSLWVNVNDAETSKQKVRCTFNQASHEGGSTLSTSSITTSQSDDRLKQQKEELVLAIKLRTKENKQLTETKAQIEQKLKEAEDEKRKLSTYLSQDRKPDNSPIQLAVILVAIFLFVYFFLS